MTRSPMPPEEPKRTRARHWLWRFVGRLGIVRHSEVRTMLADPVSLRAHVLRYGPAGYDITDFPGRCTCSGCGRVVDNAWRDADGHHCLTCLAKQRDEAREASSPNASGQPHPTEHDKSL